MTATAVRFPQVRNEKGEAVDQEVLQPGDLVQVLFIRACPPFPRLVGLYKDVRNYERGQLLLLEVPHAIQPGMAGWCVTTEVEEWDLGLIKLIDILAKPSHAAYMLFHSYGILKVEHDLLKSKIRAAVAELGGQLPY